MTHHHGGGGGGGANSPHNPGGGGANAMATPPHPAHGGAVGGAPALLSGLVGGAASGANASGPAPLADLHNHHVHDLMSCVAGSYHTSSSGGVMVGGTEGRSPSPARMAYTSEKHPRATFSELNAIRKHHDLCDVVIVVGSRKIFAHK